MTSTAAMIKHRTCNSLLLFLPIFLDYILKVFSNSARIGTPWPFVPSLVGTPSTTDSPYLNSPSRSLNEHKLNCHEHEQSLKIIGPLPQNKMCIQSSRHDGNCIPCKQNVTITQYIYTLHKLYF